ncbi:YaaA family protein [Nitratiruptor tergarcus]|uniref:Uncharacterized protein n=1 Tax=Nitratiruptor tergarcus DSM 16512 TaxID=1069081 RepID=A0A1W1WUC8_9BACT|nr:YaaA family protein [Nitratiruptor tergarcus]SMC09789.1 hypothetical protein SAMN05660197_1611 [Nitratiruptor tergarcus DSM 16512]
MKILFAPSEAKRSGGDHQKMQFCFNVDREAILQKYDDIVKHGSKEAILKLFGTKELLDIDIFHSPTLKAVRRYTGVAYEYFDYDSLHPLYQEFIDEHLIIFSNLFGPLCAKDLIPFYKLKQGEAVGDIKPEKLYAPFCKNLLQDEEILDLRAGYYEKFYKPNFSLKMKFIKNGKVVSHWAKAYRGKILRQIAENQIDSFKKLRDFSFEGLRLKEIISKKSEEIWVMEIEEH